MSNIRLLLLRIILYPLFRLLDFSFKDTEKEMDAMHRKQAVLAMMPKGELSDKQKLIREHIQPPELPGGDMKLIGFQHFYMHNPPVSRDNMWSKYVELQKIQEIHEKQHRLLMELMQSQRASYHSYVCTNCGAIETLAYSNFDKETFLCVECGLSNDE